MFGLHGASYSRLGRHLSPLDHHETSNDSLANLPLLRCPSYPRQQESASPKLPTQTTHIKTVNCPDFPPLVSRRCSSFAIRINPLFLLPLSFHSVPHTSSVAQSSTGKPPPSCPFPPTPPSPSLLPKNLSPSLPLTPCIATRAVEGVGEGVED